ncbi:hypothetical protein [Vibrio aestuarianus]|uniref:hypothetical protein n=1 Tax=Vibrio aestuarianus TaxID=28171 RepID=UPI00249AD557|nr:hypothetical protein [Vibrio aestuarianus]WDS54559.1 hypothetical protein MCL29_01740 [Vibrio aestuarianus]
MKQKNIMENRAITRAVELWSVNEIYDKWIISDTIENNDRELVEKAVSDIIVSNQVNSLLSFPNYARLNVIETLDWYNQLSMENVYYVEQQLHEARDDYQLDDMDFEVVLRAIKRN